MSRFEAILASMPETPAASVVMEAIQEIQASQGTVISKAQLKALGISSDAIRRRLTGRGLYRVPVGRGIYTGHAGPVPPEGRRWAGLLWAPTNTWLTGASAASAMNLERPRDSTIQLITHQESPRRAPAPGVLLRRTELLPPADLTTAGPFPCTDVARSLLHLAPDAHADRLGRLIAQAEQLRIYDHASMHRMLDEHPTAHGLPTFQSALSKVDADSAAARSVFELKVLDLLRSSPVLPDVAMNAMVEGVESDFWFPGTRAVIEADGRKFHRTAAQILRDAHRDEVLVRAGFQILRLLWEQVVYHPHTTLPRIVAFYEANRQPPDARRLPGQLRTL